MIKPLTSLRFFAALAVYVDHLGTQTGTGGLGVVFFFILSGFIITHTYSDKISSISFRSLASIYLKRLGRIYPVHAFTLLLALPLVFITGADTSFITGVNNALLIHSWYPSGSDFFSLNSVSWTLSVEWAFYLTFPFLIVGLKKTGVDRTAASSLLLICLCIAFMTVFSYWVYQDKQVGSATWLLRVSPINIFIFLIGSGIAFYIRHEQKSQRYAVALATGMEILALALIIAAYYWMEVKNGKATLNFDYVVVYLPVFGFCIYIFSIAKGLVSKALSNNILVHLGNLSFSFYMLHLLAIIYADRYWMPVVGENGVAVNRLYLLVVIMIACEVVYRLIENPYRAYAKEKAKIISQPNVPGVMDGHDTPSDLSDTKVRPG